VPQRSLASRFGWTLRDYAKRVWDNAGEDNVLFLAGGIAFNIILAAVPFILLLAAGLTLLLPLLYVGKINSQDAVFALIDGLMPPQSQATATALHDLIFTLLKSRTSVGLYSGVGFIWFSTRLFGSLRTVLASVFDIESERGIIQGKVFDVKITVVSTLLFVASTAVSTYILLGTSRSAQELTALGMRKDVITGLEYWVGRGLAFIFLALMFFALYKFLPVRRVRTATAWVAALFTTVMFEAARAIFSYYASVFNPASLYTGTLTVLVVMIIWFYYAALIFILGGEVGQVYELRRTRKMQRERFVDVAPA